jgi:hypothetical protein
MKQRRFAMIWNDYNYHIAYLYKEKEHQQKIKNPKTHIMGKRKRTCVVLFLYIFVLERFLTPNLWGGSLARVVLTRGVHSLAHSSQYNIELISPEMKKGEK